MRITREQLGRIIREEAARLQEAPRRGLGAAKEQEEAHRQGAGRRPRGHGKPSLGRAMFGSGPAKSPSRAKTGEESWENVMGRFADGISTIEGAVRTVRIVAGSHQGERREDIMRRVDEIRSALSTIENAVAALEEV